MLFAIIALILIGAFCFYIKENVDKLIDWIPLNWIENKKVQYGIRVALKVLISFVLGIFYLGVVFLFIVLMGASQSSKNSKQ
ncbi:MAG TPA: hypothetical protein VFW07_03160 [Parafilimonas sp.]|nr:hypothetical protein [Parafilimonas sp.]